MLYSLSNCVFEALYHDAGEHISRTGFLLAALTGFHAGNNKPTECVSLAACVCGEWMLFPKAEFVKTM